MKQLYNIAYESTIRMAETRVLVGIINVFHEFDAEGPHKKMFDLILLLVHGESVHVVLTCILAAAEVSRYGALSSCQRRKRKKIA